MAFVVAGVIQGRSRVSVQKRALSRPSRGIVVAQAAITKKGDDVSDYGQEAPAAGKGGSLGTQKDRKPSGVVRSTDKSIQVEVDSKVNPSGGRASSADDSFASKSTVRPTAPKQQRRSSTQKLPSTFTGEIDSIGAAAFYKAPKDDSSSDESTEAMSSAEDDADSLSLGAFYDIVREEREKLLNKFVKKQAPRSPVEETLPEPADVKQGPERYEDKWEPSPDVFAEQKKVYENVVKKDPFNGFRSIDFWSQK